jgi:hypothetical protein
VPETLRGGFEALNRRDLHAALAIWVPTGLNRDRGLADLGLEG